MLHYWAIVAHAQKGDDGRSHIFQRVARVGDDALDEHLLSPGPLQYNCLARPHIAVSDIELTAGVCVQWCGTGQIQFVLANVKTGVEDEIRMVSRSGSRGYIHLARCCCR